MRKLIVKHKLRCGNKKKKKKKVQEGFNMNMYLIRVSNTTSSF